MLDRKRNAFVIAELSANHNNNLDIALDTVVAAAKSGADAIKVQTYRAESLALDVDNEYFGPKKSGLWKGIRPFELYTDAALPYDWHLPLKKRAEEEGLVFFSSPFDLEGANFLEELGVPLYKIASFEITDIPLIAHVAGKGKPIIMSTGVADKDDIALAVETCKKQGNCDITLLKCTSQYPAKLSEANVTTIPDMSATFGVPVGVSDHTMGFVVPVTAVALGATVIEKHFILDRDMGGADSTFSMEPHEFKEMVDRVREVESALGTVSYDVSEESKEKRRSLFAIEDIAEGDSFSAQNIRSLRPGVGKHPKYYPEMIGMPSQKAYKRGDPL